MMQRFWLMILFLINLLLLSACSSAIHLKEGIDNFRVQNYRAAFIYLKPEAEKGQPDAQYAIGYMYYYGQGVTEDRKKAWYWINRAAIAGQPQAIAAAKMIKQTMEIETTIPTNYFPDKST